MDEVIFATYGNYSYYFLCSMITAALFFMMAGVKEIREKQLEGFLYLTVSLFFVASHFMYLFNLPVDNALSFVVPRMSIWHWLVLVLAPSVICLFVLVGALSFVMANFKAGLVKIFFGLSLMCYLFMLGTNWPVDLKGIIAFVFFLIWFHVELETA